MTEDRQLLEALAANVAYAEHWLRDCEVFQKVTHHLGWERQRNGDWVQKTVVKIPDPYGPK